MSDSGNIQQRIFDKIPVYPVSISVVGLYSALPEIDKASVRAALSNLRALGCVEWVPATKFTYRRIAGALRPQERRGGAREGAGRKRGA